MKTTNTILQVDKSQQEETLKITRTSGILKSMLAIFLLSGVTLLSSCVLWVPVPRPQSTVVVFGQGHNNNSAHKYYKYNNGNGNGNGNGKGNSHNKQNKHRH